MKKVNDNKSKKKLPSMQRCDINNQLGQFIKFHYFFRSNCLNIQMQISRRPESSINYQLCMCKRANALVRPAGWDAVLMSAIFFSKIIFSNISTRTTIRVSNSLDTDYTRYSLEADLCPNCLQRLSADDTSKQAVNYDE